MNNMQKVEAASAALAVLLSSSACAAPKNPELVLPVTEYEQVTELPNGNIVAGTVYVLYGEGTVTVPKSTSLLRMGTDSTPKIGSPGTQYSRDVLFKDPIIVNGVNADGTPTGTTTWACAYVQAPMALEANKLIRSVNINAEIQDKSLRCVYTGEVSGAQVSISKVDRCAVVNRNNDRIMCDSGKQVGRSFTENEAAPAKKSEPQKKPRRTKAGYGRGNAKYK